MPTQNPPNKQPVDTDAIALLKQDHREAEALFEQFEAAPSSAAKRKIANQVCSALEVHTQIEEEIFYPACEKAGVDKDLLDEAKVEHDGAKELIEQIRDGRTTDELWEAKVKVLSEQIEHHVKEEEGAGGMFSQMRKTDADLDAIGRRLAARKAELSK